MNRSAKEIASLLDKAIERGITMSDEQFNTLRSMIARTLSRSERQIKRLLDEVGSRGLRPMWTHFYRSRKIQVEVEENGKVTKVWREIKDLSATACVLIDENTDRVVSRGMSATAPGKTGSRLYGRCESLKRAFGPAVSSWDTDRKYLMTKGIDGIACDKMRRSVGALDPKFQMTEIELDRIRSRRDRFLEREQARQMKAMTA